MRKLTLIQSNYKGFSFYFRKEHSNHILKELCDLFLKNELSVNHFFFYFDDRFNCGFRLFVDSNLSIHELLFQLNEFIKTNSIDNHLTTNNRQFFSTHQPNSVIPIEYIFESEEIIYKKSEEPHIYDFFDNLNELIFRKLDETDFSDDNQKLELTLELLISGLVFGRLSEKNIKLNLKKYLNKVFDYEAYLKKNYSLSIDENKESIKKFKVQLLEDKTTHNPLTKFWENSKLMNSETIFEILFNVLNITDNQKCYCLYVLERTI
jgi:hypothetical protein